MGLTGLMESRMRGNVHVRFGGRQEETEPVKTGHRASCRPYTFPMTIDTPIYSSKLFPNAMRTNLC